MRLYVSSDKPNFDNDADNGNWNAANEALIYFSSKEQELLKAVYSHQFVSLPDAVSLVANEHNTRKQDIWKLLSRLQKRIAMLRGLL